MILDVAIPMAFPDFLIHVDTPPIRIDVPDQLPGVPNEIIIPAKPTKIPYLGHAGILFFNGTQGLTKYYEYGRYDPAAIGLVRKHSIRDVKISKDGRPTLETLSSVLLQVSQRAGQGGKITGAYIELASNGEPTSGAFGRMLSYAESCKKQNTDPHRPAYDLLSNSCLHFVKKVAEAGGASMPDIFLDARPVGYMGKVRSKFPDLDYQSGTLTIEGITP